MSKLGLNKKKISIGLVFLITTTLMSKVTNLAQVYDYQSDGSSKIHNWRVNNESRKDIEI